MNFEDTYEYEDAREVYHRPRDIARFGTRPIAYDDPTLINQEQPNFADAEALRRTEQITNDAWREVFDAQPYNSFFMVSWLLHLAGRSAEDLWQNPRILRRYPVQEDDMDRDTIYALVSNGGRCTTFTIQVAQELEDRQDRGDLRGLQKFEWRYHDVGRHRIARCENTGLVIHSSSPQGFLTVPPGPAGMTLDLDTDDGVPRAETLIYSDGISKWKRLRDAEIKSLSESGGGISAKMSMVQCMTELAQDSNLSPMCFFRHTISTPTALVADYDGMIIFKLDVKNPRLELRYAPLHYLVTFYWNRTKVDVDRIPTQSFTPEEHDSSLGPNYHTILVHFILTYGGPCAKKQWASCSQDFARFWRSACNLWGLPSVTGGTSFHGALHGDNARDLLQSCYIATRTDADL